MTQKLTHTKMAAYKNCKKFFYYRHEQLLQPRVQRAGQRRGGNLGTVLFRVQQETQGGKAFELRPFIIETVEELYAERHPSSTSERQELDIEKVKLIEIAVVYVET